MFDEEGAKSTNPPGNLPVEPVDVLAAVEHDQAGAPNKMPDAVSAGLLKPKMSAVSAMPTDMSAATTSSPGKKLLIIGLVVIVLIGGGVAAWYFLMRETAPAAAPAKVVVPAEQVPVVPAPAPIEPVVEPEPAPASTTPASPAALVEPEPLGVAIDTDQDGLTDSREVTAGTDPSKPDSDGDNLSDGDEVLVWKTNPLNADTDGDKFPDGTEIKNGYSPTGPGKLFPIGTGAASSSVSTGPTTVTP